MYIALRDNEKNIDAFLYVHNYDERFEGVFEAAVACWQETNHEFGDAVFAELIRNGYVFDNLNFKCFSA